MYLNTCNAKIIHTLGQVANFVKKIIVVVFPVAAYKS